MTGASHPNTEIDHGQIVEASGVHIRCLTATPLMAIGYRWLGIQWA